jgi:squalene-hopene/tetraprenyl-beta-curcumene cyclase
MPVVSYALPVLCAVGIVKYKKYPPSNIFVRALRKIALKKALKLLIQVQPDTGGYLEAAPLTAFVIHSLALSGFKDSVIVKKGLHFILKGQRSDGSWPVDSNLSVWVTCLAVQALLHTSLYNKKRFEKTARWLMNQQIKVYTPYTSAEAGGWSWTHLHGGVPDGDDTANALLTLKSLGIKNSEDTIKNGVNWLIKLQNRDGGWPTFCKGFGKLLFDRSCADVTAHAILALRKCNISMNHPCIEKGIKWLIANQQSDGSWEPLWFGNQYSRSKKNFTYATFKALKALVMCGKKNSEATKKGVEWLVANQNSDGGWGSEKGVASSAEETAFALIALMAFDDKYSSVHSSVQKGIKWLVEHQRFDGSWNAAPIGLYFAKLWYYEKLYPVVFPLIALGNYSKLRAQ